MAPSVVVWTLICPIPRALKKESEVEVAKMLELVAIEESMSP